VSPWLKEHLLLAPSLCSLNYFFSFELTIADLAACR